MLFLMIKDETMIDDPQYVDEPLAYLTVKNSDIAEYISPNAASLIVS